MLDTISPSTKNMSYKARSLKELMSSASPFFVEKQTHKTSHSDQILLSKLNRFDLPTQDGNGFLSLKVHKPDICLSTIDFTLNNPITAPLIGDDYLRIRLGLSGTGRVSGDITEETSISGAHCHIIAQPRNSKLLCTIEPHSHQLGVLFWLRRGTLSKWGCEYSELPTLLKAFERNQLNQSESATLSLTPSMLLATTELMSCKLTGSLYCVYTEAKVREIICHIIAALQQSEQPDDNSLTRLTEYDTQCLRNAHDIIVKERSNPPGIDLLARRVGLNRNKLCAGFNRMYGMPVFEYLRDFRMQHAVKLLEESALSITEIAYDAGYQHPSSFTTAVKKRYGVQPSQLRKKSL